MNRSDRNGSESTSGRPRVTAADCQGDYAEAADQREDSKPSLRGKLTAADCLGDYRSPSGRDHQAKLDKTVKNGR